MSTFRGHSRHLTWPITIDLLPNHSSTSSSSTTDPLSSAKKYKQHLAVISEDEDPFSHFLSPVLEDESDPFDDTAYSAGITPYAAEPRARKTDLFRARLEEKWEGFVARRLLQHTKPGSTGRSLPAPLPPPFPQRHISVEAPEENALPDLIEEAIDAELPRTPEEGQSGSSTPERLSWIFPSSLSSPGSVKHADFPDEESDVETDGWEADRRRLQTGVQMNRPKRPMLRSSRTLSGKRHSWREPSEELYTLDEENENDEEEHRRGRAGRGGQRKKRKMVHWDEEVQVVEYQR